MSGPEKIKGRLSDIGNKLKRQDVYRQGQAEVAKLKRKLKDKRKREEEEAKAAGIEVLKG